MLCIYIYLLHVIKGNQGCLIQLNCRLSSMEAYSRLLNDRYNMIIVGDETLTHRREIRLKFAHLKFRNMGYLE